MPRSVRSFLLLSLFMFLVIVPANAQEAPAVPDPRPADVESAENIVGAVYDVISGGAGVERDWDRFRSLFTTDAKLMPTVCLQGSCRLLVWDVETYISTAGGSLEASGFFEGEIHSEVVSFGQIIHVFSTYESRFKAEDENPFARGINSIQLFNDGNRWWVVNILWQQEGPNAQIPTEYGG